MSKVEIPYSRTKIVCLLFIVIIFGCVGAWAYTLDKTDAQIIGGITVILCITISMIFIWKLFDNRFALVIDENGFTINPQAKSETTFKWNEIDNFSEFSVNGTKMILINLKDIDAFMSKEHSLLKYRMLLMNIDICGTPCSLCANSYKISHKDLLILLNNYIK